MSDDFKINVTCIFYHSVCKQYWPMCAWVQGCPYSSLSSVFTVVLIMVTSTNVSLWYLFMSSTKSFTSHADTSCTAIRRFSVLWYGQLACDSSAFSRFRKSEIQNRHRATRRNRLSTRPETRSSHNTDALATTTSVDAISWSEKGTSDNNITCEMSTLIVERLDV